MVYGQWTDPYNEFFIIPYTPSTTDNNSLAARTGWNRLYIIESDRIPIHLSHNLVESILFVGKAIATVNEMDKILIPDEMRKKHLQLLISLYSSSSNTTTKSHHSTATHPPWIRYPQELKMIVNEVRRSTADWLFSQVLVGDHGLHKYLNSFRRLFLLDYGDFAANFIQECVLWRKRSLSNTSSNSDPKTHSKTTKIFRYQELNALLGKASIGTDAEDRLNGFSLLLTDDESNEYPFSDLLLVDLRVVLTYDLKWPIDLFLGESDLKKYSNLWSFLISLKNTQMMLNNLWKTLRNNSHQEDTMIRRQPPTTHHQFEDNDGYQERIVWRLRSLMLFWINTLWDHIQTNVIDAHYQQLIDTTTPNSNLKRKSFEPKAKLDFEEIQAAHEQFLQNTMRGCLLTSVECRKTVHEILKFCSDFCELMERISKDGEWRTNKRRKTTTKTAATAAEIVNQWTKSSTDFPWMENVKQIEENFTLSTESFFTLASSQQPEIKANGRLDVLLIQLDYNKWFSGQKS
ncbi:Spc98 family-domain-containing protein [Pilaira anomala]|nr:Spc98 family-domain-containing protein [Pilaira anomala]